MARLPMLRRKPSRTDQALDLVKNAARVWTLLRLSSAASSAAKGGAKAYGTAKTAKVAGRPALKVLVVPAAAIGGFALWRKLSSSSPSADDAVTYDQERPLGPVATPQAVSPPAPEPASGALTDPPAGASNPAAAPEPGPAATEDEPPVGPSPTFANETT